MNVLVVVDMQNDFISGVLGTPEAVTIVDYVKNKIEQFSGEVIFTRDTHNAQYLDTREGEYLPVEHCIQGTPGWEICDHLLPFTRENLVIDKPTFGSTYLIEQLTHKIDEAQACQQDITFTLVGVCTDICVISNALLIKASFPESKIIVDSNGCAGVTPATHTNALEAMKMCHIEIQ